jgi:hypothetical protein
MPTAASLQNQGVALTRRRFWIDGVTKEDDIALVSRDRGDGDRFAMDFRRIGTRLFGCSAEMRFTEGAQQAR